MTVASVQNMNGQAPVAGRGARRVTPPIFPGEHWTKRRRLERGETYRSQEVWAPMPMTPESNDERNLPLFGRPLQRLPIRDYSRSYQGYYAPYREFKPAVWPEVPPMPSGYGNAPLAQNELLRALRAAQPSPAVNPSQMTVDISGMGDIWTDIGAALGLTPQQSTTSNIADGVAASPEGQAATGAVQNAATDAAAKGASPSLVQSIIDFGSKIAGLYLTKRQLDKMEQMQERERQAEMERLRLEAARAQAPPAVQNDFRTTAPVERWYHNPLYVGAAALGTMALGFGLYKVFRPA
jgi:hypothetical protein